MTHQGNHEIVALAAFTAFPFLVWLGFLFGVASGHITGALRFWVVVPVAVPVTVTYLVVLVLAMASLW